MNISYIFEEQWVEFEIRNKNLFDLYYKGKSKKYKLHNYVIKKFSMIIQSLEASPNIYDLWKTASLNFERLKGYENRYSVRLTNKLRLEMEIIWNDEEKTIGKIFILEISKHYGD